MKFLAFVIRYRYSTNGQENEWRFTSLAATAGAYAACCQLVKERELDYVRIFVEVFGDTEPILIESYIEG